MRIPKKPPALTTIVKENPERVFEVIRSHKQALVNGKYLHWDQLRHRSAPEGLTHQEWWLSLKYRRSANATPIPLLDKSGDNFEYNLVGLIQEALHHIDPKVGGGIGTPDAILNEPLKDKYYISLLIQESIASSQLEGATTTRHIAKEMLLTGRTPRDHSEQMILNNYITMSRIRDLKDEEMSPGLLREIHSLISKDTMDDSAQEGRFRGKDDKADVYHATSDIVVHVPPPATTLEDRIEQLCLFANGKIGDDFIHPVIQSIVLHFWIGYVHPFVDGNGRTARALFYWSMLRHGYSLIEFISISKILLKSPTNYGLAYLYTETDENDLNYFIIHQLDTIQKAIEELELYVKNKEKQFREAAKELAGLDDLNHRQQTLIHHALRNPHQKYTIKSHGKSHNVTKITAGTDLQKLTERGLLEKSKFGREFVFTAAHNLERKLSSE